MSGFDPRSILEIFHEIENVIRIESASLMTEISQIGFDKPGQFAAQNNRNNIFLSQMNQ